MIAWLRSLFSMWRETQRIKEENARKERRLMAAIESPRCTPELLEEATIYFMKPKADSVKEAKK
jgi:hypothetical protein